MKLIKPLGLTTQPFGANYNNSYKDSGLKGHTGIDYVLNWKYPIKAVVTGEVYSILNEHNPNTNKYRAVFQLVDDIEYSYEVSYGHIDSALCKEGDIVQAGTPIATEGNYGTCFTNGKLVTPEEKATGKGSHLHFQVRKLKRVKKRKKGEQYVRSSEGYVKRGGYFYEVVDYTNGYNGCIDPSQFYAEDTIIQPKFARDLTIGSKGEDVVILQDFLKEKGFFPLSVPSTGYFGNITKTALIGFQKANKIEPAFGYFGVITRSKLNALLS
jgi:murein DD-endopeptidase MepM/ murein hydrolase activator NlpD